MRERAKYYKVNNTAIFFGAIEIIILVCKFLSRKIIYFIDTNPYILENVLQILFMFWTSCYRGDFVIDTMIFI